MGHECSKGWATRCARAKSRRCRCACGGHNHGNKAARKGEGEEPMITDLKIFEREFICKVCHKPLAHSDDLNADECHGEGPCAYAGSDYRDYNFLLSTAQDQEDIHLARSAPYGAQADIPHRFVVHSPTGFEWGYQGSGPADLALNILGLFVPPPEAYRLHQHYKRDVVARLDRTTPYQTITAQSVIDWLQNHWRVEREVTVET